MYSYHRFTASGREEADRKSFTWFRREFYGLGNHARFASNAEMCRYLNHLDVNDDRVSEHDKDAYAMYWRFQVFTAGELLKTLPDLGV